MWNTRLKYRDLTISELKNVLDDIITKTGKPDEKIYVSGSSVVYIHLWDGSGITIDSSALEDEHDPELNMNRRKRINDENNFQV